MKIENSAVSIVLHSIHRDGLLICAFCRYTWTSTCLDQNDSESLSNSSGPSIPLRRLTNITALRFVLPRTL